MTQQPQWRCIANLGDVNPIEHGGAFLYIDMTGVYAPELEVWQPHDDSDYGYSYRVCMGIADYPDWADFEAVARCVYYPVNYSKTPAEALAHDLRADNLHRRAQAFIAVGDYHGYCNFDHDGTHRTFVEARRRYRHAHGTR